LDKKEIIYSSNTTTKAIDQNLAIAKSSPITIFVSKIEGLFAEAAGEVLPTITPPPGSVTNPTPVERTGRQHDEGSLTAIGCQTKIGEFLNRRKGVYHLERELYLTRLSESAWLKKTRYGP
jgi:hypothetical protein